MSRGDDGTDGLTDDERRRRVLGRRIAKAKGSQAKSLTKVSAATQRMLDKLAADVPW